MIIFQWFYQLEYKIAWLLVILHINFPDHYTYYLGSFMHESKSNILEQLNLCKLRLIMRYHFYYG